MILQEYLKLVNFEVVKSKDFGKWINFNDSYPPLNKEPYNGVLIEILHEGNPYFHSVFHDGEGNVRLRCYDWNQELLEYCNPDYTKDYWRFVPSPPGNEGYDVG